MARRKPELLPPGPEHVVLSPQDAARAELDGAVDLFVRFANLAATHVLASAAHEVVRSAARRNRVELPHDILNLTSHLDEETRELVRYAMTHAYNSLKHSSGREEERAYFHPKFVETHLVIVIDNYQTVFRDISPKMLLYKAWFIKRNRAQIEGRVDINWSLFKFDASGATLDRSLFGARQLMGEIDRNSKALEEDIQRALSMLAK